MVHEIKLFRGLMEKKDQAYWQEKKYLIRTGITRCCACPIGLNDEIQCNGEIDIVNEYCELDQWEHENGKRYEGLNG